MITATNVAIPEPKTFTYGNDTLLQIKEGKEKYQKFMGILPVIKDNLFIYGINGDSGGLTQHERWYAVSLFKKITEALNIAHNWPVKAKSDNYALHNCVGNFQWDKMSSKRFTDDEFIRLILESTTYWKSHIAEDIPDLREVIPAVELIDWFTGLAAMVHFDQIERLEKAN